MTTQPSKTLNDFAEDVRLGLNASPKFLSSKYFYDDAGSDLFQQIMNLPEYYLTRTETEIFSTQKKEIADFFSSRHQSFDLIELGAGDGTKTAILIEELLERKIDFTYQPIDISSAVLDFLVDKFAEKFPDLNLRTQHGDYFRILETLKTGSDRAKIIFFLGSNIGNFTDGECVSFLQHLRAVINPNDLLFIGFDLQKDPRLILSAYDDAQGVTAAFNLNLLTRINRELGADFDLDKFSHYALYHPGEGLARSFLISREDQDVRIETIDQTIHFKKWEDIYMEISQKYTLEMIEEIAAQSGFEMIQNFCDKQNFYTDSVWKPI